MTGARSLAGSDQPLIERYDVALLDLDGVLYLGDQAVAGAVDEVDEARRGGTRLCYVTNNASRTPESVAEQLRKLGYPAGPADVVTSAQAAAAVVVQRFGAAARVLAIGGVGLRVALEQAGCALVDSADDRPDAVVQGWSPDLGYHDLAEAALAVGRGAWWLATNRDRTLPTARGIQPGNGALVGAVQVATGRPPDAFAGKPDPALIAEALRRTKAERPIMVGDRLDTDIAGARAAGVDSLLVLTGASDGADLIAAPEAQRPTYLALDLSGLLRCHGEPADGGGVVRCGGWTARRDGATVFADPQGEAPDPADLLRAVAACAWAPESTDSTAAAAPSVTRLEVPPACLGQAGQARLDGLLDGRR